MTTLAEKIRACSRSWSNSEVAEIVGTSVEYVRAVRQRASGNDAAARYRRRNLEYYAALARARYHRRKQEKAAHQG